MGWFPCREASTEKKKKSDGHSTKPSISTPAAASTSASASTSTSTSTSTYIPSAKDSRNTHCSFSGSAHGDAMVKKTHFCFDSKSQGTSKSNHMSSSHEEYDSDDDTRLLIESVLSHQTKARLDESLINLMATDHFLSTQVLNYNDCKSFPNLEQVDEKWVDDENAMSWYEKTYDDGVIDIPRQVLSMEELLRIPRHVFIRDDSGYHLDLSMVNKDDAWELLFFKCQKCADIFLTLEELENHLNEEHQNKFFFCRLRRAENPCFLKFKDERSRNIHEDLHDFFS